MADAAHSETLILIKPGYSIAAWWRPVQQCSAECYCAVAAGDAGLRPPPGVTDRYAGEVASNTGTNCTQTNLSWVGQLPSSRNTCSKSRAEY